MQKLLLMVVAVVLVGCGKDEPEPSYEQKMNDALDALHDNLNPPPKHHPNKIANIKSPFVLRAVLRTLKKPVGKFAPKPIITYGELAKLESLIDVDESLYYTDSCCEDLIKIENLRSISFGPNNRAITDKGIKILADNLKNVTYVYLPDNTTNASVIAVVEGFPRLQMLYCNWLHNNAIGKHLHKAKQLSKLNLFSCNTMTPAIFHELAKLPLKEITLPRVYDSTLMLMN